MKLNRRLARPHLGLFLVLIFVFTKGVTGRKGFIIGVPKDLAKVTHEVTFYVNIGTKYAGELVIGLFGDDVPKTVTNFYTLCTTGIGNYTFKGNRFTSIIKGHLLQGGHFFGTNNDVTLFGGHFADEAFAFRHTVPMLLTMANTGPNTNGASFYITMQPMIPLDGHNVVFGKVLQGRLTLRKLEALPIDDNGLIVDLKAYIADIKKQSDHPNPTVVELDRMEPDD